MSLQLEIISPEKILFQGEVAMAIIPGEEGDFGVLPNHQPIIAQLQAGEVQVFDKADSAPSKTFKIEGGFAETDGTKCIILSDDVKAEDQAA